MAEDFFLPPFFLDGFQLQVAVTGKINVKACVTDSFQIFPIVIL